MRASLYVLFGLVGIIAFSFISRLFGGGGETTPSVAVATVGVVTSSTRFWVLTATGAFILVVWAVVNYTTCQDNWRARFRNCPPPAWAFAVFLGVTTFHWLFWAIGPGAWNAWLSSQTFWPMNVAIVLAAFFASQHGAATRYASFALWILLLVAIGIGAYEKYGYFFQPKAPATSSSLPRLPAEVALPIIAECESKGRQFNSDGSIVTNNNTDGTIDRGKWQINSRHDERVKRLGIDILTEEGNEKFARILYAENYLRDWEASRHCWEPKLMALGHVPGLSPSSPTSTPIPTTDTTFVVTVRPSQPAEVNMPPGWMIVWWGDKSRFTSHAIWRGEDKVRVFTTRTGVGSAEIKIHRYYDPDPNWWRRQ